MLAPIMQFYFYIIDRKKIIGAKWSSALALLLRKEKMGFLKSMVLKVLDERHWHNIT
jgi:hypothetical protein